MNHITYAIPVWGPFVSVDLWEKIRAFWRSLGVMVSLQAFVIFRHC